MAMCMTGLVVPSPLAGGCDVPGGLLADVELRLVSWNAKALFSSHHASKATATKRLQQLKRLCASCPIVSLQEVHGNPRDSATLDKELASHLRFLCTMEDRIAGGVLICISK